MADPRAVIRLIDELVWMVRREGVRVSTAQAIDGARAVRAVGLSDPSVLREALAAVLVTRQEDRAAFERGFLALFSSSPHVGLFDRLVLAGFTDAELHTLRELLGADERMLALMEGGSEVDRLMQLAGIERELGNLGSPMQAGFFAQRIVDRIGAGAARQRLGALRAALVGALGERGDALATALEAELDRTTDDVRGRVRKRASAPDEKERRTASEKLFNTLLPGELAEVRQAVRSFAARLRGAERARKKRASRGPIDPHRTLRLALRTAGVPFAPARRRRRRDRPRLVVLCDVSDSVRSVSAFLLEFTYAAQELFAKTRSFVFVSELGEVTDVFANASVGRALGIACGGGVVSVTDNSNYGRVLQAFEARYLRSIDRRTTVVILGDGRTNYHPDASHVLARIRERARALVWLCPEARSTWSSGDSAMARYARECSQVLEVRSARDLETAARALLSRRT